MKEEKKQIMKTPTMPTNPKIPVVQPGYAIKYQQNIIKGYIKITEPNRNW